MNLLHKTVYTLLGSALLFSALQAQTLSKQEAITKGEASAMLLIKTLGKNMKKNMKSGGPMQALDFCSNEAYSLTQKVNKKLDKSTKVKRISTKNRSPLNKPSKEEAQVLADLQKLQDEGKTLPKYILTKEKNGDYKYYKPLLISKQVCLKCHGNLKASQLKSAIHKRYPNDSAMGYKMGDLRGAVVVQMHNK